MNRNIVACPVHGDNETTKNCPDCRPYMTNPSMRKKIEETIIEELDDFAENYRKYVYLKELKHAQKNAVITILALFKEIVEDIKDKNFLFMEPCEPNCDTVRHARHEGSWGHYLRMEKAIDEILKRLRE